MKCNQAIGFIIFALFCGALPADILTTVADTFIRSPNNGDTNYGSSTTLQVGNNVSNAKDKNLIDYVKFDLSSFVGTISTATFTLDVLTTQIYTFDVFGLPNGDADEDFVESTLTFNTSSHTTIILNDPVGTTGSLDPTGLTALGSFTTSGTPGTLDFSTSALVDFLNADNNDIATLIFHPSVNTAGVVASMFASREHATALAPQLTLTAIPEPSSLLLMLCGFSLMTIRFLRRP